MSTLIISSQILAYLYLKDVLSQTNFFTFIFRVKQIVSSLISRYQQINKNTVGFFSVSAS